MYEQLDAMEIIGYLASILIGLSLGITGGGGSILTVPVLVYLFGESPEVSTAYSLFIVGATSLVGAIRNATLGHVDYKIGVVFGIPSIIAVYLTRAYLVSSIPLEIISFASFTLTKDKAIMMLFAFIMLAASISMIRNTAHSKFSKVSASTKFNIVGIFAEGFVVGVLTGIVGAGGGFLIIPSLVLFAKLPMKKAIGTSLLIIALKSLIGFTGDIQRTDLTIDTSLLLSITGFAVVGIFVGRYCAKFINDQSLKKGFGWFVLLTAGYIILQQIE